MQNCPLKPRDIVIGCCVLLNFVIDIVIRAHIALNLDTNDDLKAQLAQVDMTAEEMSN